MERKREKEGLTKKDFLERLFNVWCDNPEMRFGQLLICAIKNLNSNVFYIEDDLFIKTCEEKLKYNCETDGCINVFSGEVLSSHSEKFEWAFICEKCHNQSSIEHDKNWKPNNINRERYLKVLSEKKPESNSIPPLLERCSKEFK